MLTVDAQAADVSVIIPTRNRPQLVCRAIESALGQTSPPREVIVVIDGPDARTAATVGAMADPRVRWVQLPESLGAASARNAGVALATGAWIAFLDDDDRWLPTKLALQRRVIDAHDEPSRLVLGTAVSWRTEEQDLTWPLRRPAPREAIADYLFVRQRAGEGLFATPSVMLRREFASAVPMPPHLRLHEDWAWFLELEAAGAVFDVVMEPLVVVDGGAGRASLSRSSSWELSLRWALEHRGQLGERAFSAFCLTEVGRQVGAQQAPTAIPRILRAALSGKPKVTEIGRFLAICLLSERLRWRIARTLVARA